MNRKQIERAIENLECLLQEKIISARLVSRLNAQITTLPSEYHAMFQTQFNYINTALDGDNFDIARIPIERLIGCYDFLLESSFLRDIEQNLSELVAPSVELSHPDRDEIMVLIGVMRTLVNDSLLFDLPHKRRLLDRISAIELEALKDKGKFDVFLGGIVDAGEALGKFGEAAKPLFDRMAEVAGIAPWSSSGLSCGSDAWYCAQSCWACCASPARSA